MREFKFRAWENNRKEIIHVHNIDFEKKIINTGSAWRFFGEIELMQFTGLKDKNGKEIYEGDIVQYNEEEIGIVKFGHHETDGADYYSSQAYGFYICIPGYVDEEFSLDGGRCEVIGNIYENKELLEK